MPNALRAAGDAKYTMTVAVFSMAVFRIGFGVFLATTMGMGVIGVWIAMQIDWVFRIICFLIRWHSGKWQTKTLVVKKSAVRFPRIGGVPRFLLC